MKGESMSKIVTVASGKGGVGKSVTVANLGLALAARDRSVILADLDVGGSNLATLFGVFGDGPDLGAFFSHAVDDLADVVRPLWRNLSLIVGAGDTLATANPNWGMKQRLLRHLSSLDADVVIVDVGAGAGSHALDFFNAGEIRILVTVPEPTASVDAYRFIKLATIRESVTRVSTRNPDRRIFERKNFESAQDVWESIDATGHSSKCPALDVRATAPTIMPATAPTTTPTTTPWVIVNQAEDARRSFERLQLVTRRFMGRNLRLFGEVPRSADVRDSVNNFLPVVEAKPDSPAAMAFKSIARKLDDELTRVSRSGGSMKVESPKGSELPDLSRAWSLAP